MDNSNTNFEEEKKIDSPAPIKSQTTMNADVIKLLLILGGIVLLVVAYLLIYTPVSSDIDTLNMTLTQKQAEYTQMVSIAQNEQKYKEDTETYQTNIENILASYPSQVYYEDEVYYVRDVLEQNHATLSFDSATFKPSVLVTTSETAMAQQNAGTTTDTTGAATDTTSTDTTSTDTTASTTDTTATTDTTTVTTDTTGTTAPAAGTYQLFTTPVDLTATVGYDDLKDTLNYINQDTVKKDFDTVTIAFDENSGNLSLTMTLNFFTIVGTENTYQASTIPNTTGIGKANIFGTMQ